MSATPDLKIALVLLSFDEVEGLSALLPRLGDLDALSVDEIFAIDAGSKDGTLKLYEQYGVPFHLQKERGRGEAMRMATQVTDADYIIFFSPDGNEDLKDIPKFRTYFEQGYDLVIASRMMKGARNEEDDDILRFRKWANKGFNLAANLAFRRTGFYITDSINGFRGVKRSLLMDLQLDAVGYTIEYQMTMRAMRKKKRIAEFPTRESERIGGKTKAHSIPTGLKFLKCFWKECLKLSS